MYLTFIKVENDYQLAGGNWTHAICSKELSYYFDLSDKPEQITIRLSLTIHDNSYFIKAEDCGVLFYLRITESSGKIHRYHVYSGIVRILNKFPNGCYVSVIA